MGPYFKKINDTYQLKLSFHPHKSYFIFTYAVLTTGGKDYTGLRKKKMKNVHTEKGCVAGMDEW